jgi:hypothetical protein
MADCYAGNQRQRPNPPRLLQKPDHVVLISLANEKRGFPTAGS